MKSFFHILLVIGIIFTSCQSEKQSDPDDIYFEKADSLLDLLSLEEKVGQMTNIGLPALIQGPFWNDFDTLLLDTAKMKDLLINFKVGSIQNKGKYPPSKEEWFRIIKTIQKYVLRNSEHKIPILFGIDGVHGANYTAGSTIFPHQLAVAATWNPEFARITGEVTSYELKASSTPWNYAPVLDVTMQALWGRVFETFGEDTYLTGVMGEAYVEGSQGNSLSDDGSVAVCLKHFIGYGTPVSGKDRSPAIIPENYLRQYYLDPFRKAIDKGALTLMINSGSVNGIPGHADHYLLTELLKGELGLKGFLISDWGDLESLVTIHHVAENKREAAKISVLAGMDMCMVPYDASFAADVISLVKNGEIPMSRIDDAVRRILFVKFKLGIFEKPWNNPKDYPKFGSTEFSELSYDAASEAITLLKNENEILPLQKDKIKILVTGPSANKLTSLNGPWSRTWKGDDPTYDDPGKLNFYQAMQSEFGTNSVSFEEGVAYKTDFKENTKLLNKAKSSDVIFICLGEEPASEKLLDIHNLDLPVNQRNLIKYLHKTGKPIVLVLLQGRSRIIRDIEPLVDGVLHAYWPGNEGGRALADIISGDVNPSGKLPYTYQRYNNTLHTYQHKNSDKFDDSFGMNGFNPQWEFGYGLSYSKFKYDGLVISSDTMNAGENMQIKVRLTNESKIIGKEVVQLYLRDKIASISPDDRKLIAFTKIELGPGESKIVELPIKNKDLMFVDRDNKWIAEKGQFELMMGGRPDNMLTTTFYYSGIEKN